MKEYFSLLDDIFQRLTGKKYTKFATPETFVNAIHENANTLSRRIISEGQGVVDDLINYYQQRRNNNLLDAKNTSRTKLVLGGRSRFTDIQFGAIKKMALYTDTILIPDPILPWLEIERSEEKYRNVLMLQQIFMMLQLKPLVDINIDTPPIYVFQSYEKSLERQDEFTKNAINNFFLAFLGNYLGIEFSSIDESLDYVTNNQDEFIDKVSKQNLFIGPSGVIKKSYAEHLRDYKEYVQEWRSEDHLQVLKGIPESILVWNALFENVSPFWHLIENSEELIAQPLLCMDSHWHYYKLLNASFNDRLKKQNYLSDSITSSLEALSFERFKWLGNVPINEIARIKLDGGNELFKSKLNAEVSNLHSSQLEDLEMVSKQISKALNSLLREHSKEVIRLEEKYKRKQSLNILGAWITAGVIFSPSLAPLMGLSKPIFGLATKFFWDAYNESLDRKKLSKSLLGVLANANRS